MTEHERVYDLLASANQLLDDLELNRHELSGDELAAVLDRIEGVVRTAARALRANDGP
jgi:hypothetical protein